MCVSLEIKKRSEFLAMDSEDHALNHEDMVVDEGLGYPKAYAKLSRNGGFVAYNYGPPFTFTPFLMQKHEVLRAKEMDKLFPVTDPKAKPTKKPKIFASLLWKQLNHLGNAGFDPEVIRVDCFGNVIYSHADKASPLAWDIDHWFPCQRGGLTVPSNLRILQWQVCKRKHNKLEFLVPWWDLQIGISVNQFLSIFAASNSDFRHRAFSFWFLEGENEELNASQTVESHSFPQHFTEPKEQLGLAPAAIVTSKRGFNDSSMPFRPLDYNSKIGTRKVKPSVLKENEDPDIVGKPYLAIAMARDSLKQREEAQKVQAEMQKLDVEMSDMKRKNDEEKLAIQDLELALTKRRRRAEKCRKIAEAQSSYKTMLEKMVRDAMHQSVICKEQVRLNQAATNALMARLEAQKAMSDASEKELHKKFKQRDELEKLTRSEWEQARKRSRMQDTPCEDKNIKPGLLVPRTPLRKELRVFLEEEHEASQSGLSANEDEKHAGIEEELIQGKSSIGETYNECNKAIVALERETPVEQRLQILDIGEEIRKRIQFPVMREQVIEEDEESRNQRGKGNVEKWLQMLLENAEKEAEHENLNEYGKWTDEEEANTSEQSVFENKESGTKMIRLEEHPKIEEEQEKGVRIEGKAETETAQGNLREVGCERSKAEEGKEGGVSRSRSARTLRRVPSSPLIEAIGDW
ncbi:hypothetical protein K2173_004258 [Erythroxylum novogranatense]|uniref:Uncharacterized protein n=1 Tax=Erythroxylum novogranatense TaxID=1862640 RepID=A0AAV8U2M8_9ROSI|nr:hypothetical protein K2173_004258 [Erythroxylum novogranatense]